MDGAGASGGSHGAVPHGPSASEPALDELHDSALHDEIELVGQLVVAATSTPHRLTQTQIDEVLGVGETE